jgi:hypothetical protein
MSLTPLSLAGNSLIIPGQGRENGKPFFYSAGKEDLHIRGLPPTPIVTNGSIPGIIQSSGKQLWGMGIPLGQSGKGTGILKIGITNNLLFEYSFFQKYPLYSPDTLLASLIATLLSL